MFSISVKLIHLIKFVILHIHSTLEGKKASLFHLRKMRTHLCLFNQKYDNIKSNIKSHTCRHFSELSFWRKTARGQWGGLFKHFGYLTVISAKTGSTEGERFIYKLLICQFLLNFLPFFSFACYRPWHV